MRDLTADGVLNPDAPFEHQVQWVFWELWHHEGRRARHGATHVPELMRLKKYFTPQECLTHV